MTIADEDLAGALAAWMAERTGADNVTVSELFRPPAGQSNDTVLFNASFAGQVNRLVLRRQANGTPIFRDPDVTREARVLQGLSAAGVRRTRGPMD